MKHLLLIFSLLLAFTGSAQEMYDMVGEELLIAKKKAGAGYVFVGIGMGVSLAGGALVVDDPDAAKMLVGVGYVSLGIGLLHFISAWNHVGKAGELMKLDAMSLHTYPSRDGLTLALRF